MKYVFIEKHQADFSIKAMCRVLWVARSGWYAWRLSRQQITPRQQFRLVCNTAVRQTFTEAKQRCGAPRLTDELHAQGYRFSVKTVAASLRRQGVPLAPTLAVFYSLQPALSAPPVLLSQL